MKNHFRTIFLSLCTLSAPYVAHSQCVTDSNNIYAFTYNGDNYEIIKENLNWVDAANCALTRGGFLAEINSQQEQDNFGKEQKPEMRWVVYTITGETNPMILADKMH